MSGSVSPLSWPKPDQLGGVHNKYKRTLADVFLSEGINVNHTLIKEGWCWWYRKYAPGNTVLEGLEAEAREAKRGLWVDPQPVPSWVYRKAKRAQARDLSDMCDCPFTSTPEPHNERARAHLNTRIYPGTAYS